jgi:hypothetical protein
MYFGKYLVEKDYITEEQLVLAIAEQSKSVPSVIDAMITLGNLSTNDHYKILVNSIEKNLDVLSSIKDLQYSDDVINSLLKAQTESSESLLSILVKMGVMDVTQVKNVYDEYNSNYSTGEVVDITNPTAGTGEKKRRISEAALESMRDLGLEPGDELEDQLLEQEANENDQHSDINEAGLKSLKEIGGDLSDAPVEEIEFNTTPDGISSAALESLKELGGDLGEADMVEESNVSVAVEVEEGISEAALESLKELGGDLSDAAMVEEADVSVTVEEDEGISEAALGSLKELGGDLGDAAMVEEADFSVVVEVDEGISEAALESLKELGGDIDDALMIEESGGTIDASADILARKEEELQLDPTIKEYIDTYTTQKNKKISRIISMIDTAAKDDQDIANYFNSLFRELHVVKGAALIVEAKYSTKLVEIWEHIIDKFFSMDNEKIKNCVGLHLQTLSASSSILWNIREYIASGKTEELYMSVENNQNEYLDTINKLKAIIKEIS